LKMPRSNESGHATDSWPSVHHSIRLRLESI
jgi:hypothetical protein